MLLESLLKLANFLLFWWRRRFVWTVIAKRNMQEPNAGPPVFWENHSLWTCQPLSKFVRHARPINSFPKPGQYCPAGKLPLDATALSVLLCLAFNRPVTVETLILFCHVKHKNNVPSMLKHACYEARPSSQLNSAWEGAACLHNVGTRPWYIQMGVVLKDMLYHCSAGQCLFPFSWPFCVGRMILWTLQIMKNWC